MNFFSWLGKKIGLRDGRFWSAWYGGDSWAGEPVSLDTAMQVGAFAGCVKLYAQTISTLPLDLWEKQADGSRRQVDSEIDVARVATSEPNADQDSAEFWESILAWWAATGNGVGEKVFDNPNLPSDRRRLISIDLLNPNYMIVDRSTGAKVYKYRPPGRGEREITEDRIFHLRGLSFGADIGLSVIETARQSISASRATERAAASHFANGMRPSGWLVYKGGETLTPDQRELARKNLISPMQGAENAGKIGILEGEFDYRQMTIEPEAAQLLESRRFSVEDICRWFGVPPVLLSHASQGQTMWGSGIEQIVLGWYVLQLRPRLVRLERAMNRQLLTATQRRTMYFEHNAEGLLRGDSVARAEFYWKMLQVGAMTPNQICDKENLPRWVGGDRHFVNQLLAPLDETGTPVPAAGPGQNRRAEDNNPPPQQRKLEVVK